MNTQENTVTNLIDYIDRVEASLVADYDYINNAIDKLSQDNSVSHAQRSDLLWDIAEVKIKLIRARIALKETQNTLRGLTIASKKI